MSCNLIQVVRGRKVARAITSEEEYRQLRGSAKQQSNLRLARAGNETAKRRLVQFNYSGHYPEGTVKGCKLPSAAFGFDLDNREDFERAAAQLLANPERYGLLMLERSARQGGHAVFKRELGRTILENQVRIAMELRCEMDTSAHDINRVYFSTTDDPDELLYVSPQLFTDVYDPFTVCEEANCLEERESFGQEELPPGAHKADKHFRPFPAAADPTQPATDHEPIVMNHVDKSANGCISKHRPVDNFVDKPVDNRSVVHNSVDNMVDKAVEKAVDNSVDKPVDNVVDRDRNKAVEKSVDKMVDNSVDKPVDKSVDKPVDKPVKKGGKGLDYSGIPYAAIITAWWERYYNGQEPVRSNRNTLTFELAVNLRHICGFDRAMMARIIPNYDGFSEQEKMKCIDSALSEKLTTMPKRLRDILNELAPLYNSTAAIEAAVSPEMEEGGLLSDPLSFYRRLPVLPQGPKESVDAIGPTLAMPALTAICPAIGALATGVKLVVHGKECNLNLISYIVGECASNKGSIDPVIDSWMWEVKQFDKMYLQQEDEWRARKRAAKNQKDQPDEPKLPIRCLTLNNTVANLAERLSNTDGKHAFSFTPEADTVAQKWKSAMCDFSVMLRQSYDGTRYEREARSAEAVNVHIDKLLWNVTMCGTPDALYRVVSNYTDGFQTRVAVARTPDNTFSPLEEQPDVLTPERSDRIRQVAHLLPLLAGTIDLPLLEQKGRDWLEQIRQLTLKNDDKVMARQRFRICVTAQRMTCCLLLCQVCEELIREFGLNGAEKRLKVDPELWMPRLFEAEKGPLLAVYDVLADALLETALYYFRERIEQAYQSKSYAGTSQARRLFRGKNDSIYERLDVRFTFEQAMQCSLTIKGTEVTRNAVHQMLKNWRTQGLIERVSDGKFRKLS